MFHRFKLRKQRLKCRDELLFFFSYFSEQACCLPFAGLTEVAMQRLGLFTELFFFVRAEIFQGNALHIQIANLACGATKVLQQRMHRRARLMPVWKLPGHFRQCGEQFKLGFDASCCGAQTVNVPGCGVGADQGKGGFHRGDLFSKHLNGAGKNNFGACCFAHG